MDIVPILRDYGEVLEKNLHIDPDQWLKEYGDKKGIDTGSFLYILKIYKQI